MPYPLCTLYTRPQMQYTNIVFSCCTPTYVLCEIVVRAATPRQLITRCHPGGEAVGAENYGSNAA